MININNDFDIENWYEKELDFEDMNFLNEYASLHKIPITIVIKHKPDKSCYYVIRKRTE